MRKKREKWITIASVECDLRGVRPKLICAKITLQMPLKKASPKGIL